MNTAAIGNTKGTKAATMLRNVALADLQGYWNSGGWLCQVLLTPRVLTRGNAIPSDFARSAKHARDHVDPSLALCGGVFWLCAEFLW